jgi:hypothetical protein
MPRISAVAPSHRLIPGSDSDAVRLQSAVAAALALDWMVVSREGIDPA